jgi:hypothetical protein
MKAIILSFLFFCTYGYSQKVAFEYVPKNKDSVIHYINAIHDKKIVKFGDNHKKLIAENIRERKKHFVEKVSDSSFIFNKKITSYLNSILKQIYQANPELDKKDFYFFVDKSQIPNASCYGNGIFTVHLGLFNFINSDDELAFIICHEMAHYYLEHNDKAFLAYIETITSKDIKKKINSVKNKQYGKRKAYSELMDELSLNFLKRSQSVEIEADSLGLLFFKKTKFNLNASISSLENIEKADNLIFNQESKLKEYFNFENYPFKQAWLAKDETLFDLAQKSDDFIKDADSISTHPAIPMRIKKLEALINQSGTKNAVNSTQIQEIKEIIGHISINNFIDSNRIDLAFYQCLLMYNQQLIERKEYVSTMSKLLMKTYELKNNHTFGKYVSPVYPFSDEQYLNEIKLFLNNIELKNVKKIGLNFCLSNEEYMKNDIAFAKTLEFFKKLNL